MSNLVLVDSSFYITHLTQRRQPFETLDKLVERYDFAVCGIVWMEVLRGRSNPAVRAFFDERFATMHFLNLTPAGWRRAAGLAWEMDRRGEIIPATDLAIAACAIEHGATVLTFDKHFRNVPGIVAIDQLL
ncbi:MAG TPA: PIN domain-containing protein [Opitutaceae bacterium]